MYSFFNLCYVKKIVCQYFIPESVLFSILVKNNSYNAIIHQVLDNDLSKVDLTFCIAEYLPLQRCGYHQKHANSLSVSRF